MIDAFLAARGKAAKAEAGKSFTRTLAKSLAASMFG